MRTMEDLYIEGEIRSDWKVYIMNELYDETGEEYLIWYGTVAGLYDIHQNKNVLEIDRKNKYIVLDA